MSASCWSPERVERARTGLTRSEQDELDRLLAPVAPSAADLAEEHARCAADVFYWLDTYGKTYDPRLSDPLIPFHPYPRQAEFLTWLAEGEQLQEDGLAEKSRDVGFTWLCAAYALHGWLFRTGFAAGFGSRKLGLVDTLGDPSCIFEKIRILLRHLPEWMWPRGFKWGEHDNFARLLNPETGATITGEGGDQIGRGGRQTIYFIDEAAFLEHPQRIEAALSQTTRCRVWVSTPNGPGNAFYRKRFSGTIRVFTFHWKDDPRKDQAWYLAECARIGDPVVVAQEIDIDYTASIEGICIPAAWVQAAVDLELPESGELLAGFDIGEEGRDKCVLMPRRGPVVKMPTSWGQMNTTQTAWKARDAARELGVKKVQYDADGPGMGVKGTWNSSEEPLGFVAVPVHGGGTPSLRMWPDGKTSAEKFINLRAELWWLLRRRFEKAYEFKILGIAHPLDEMISIPNCPELIADLSLPLVETTDTGKIRLESKIKMKARGVKSPDFGDALAYSEGTGKTIARPQFGTLKRGS